MAHKHNHTDSSLNLKVAFSLNLFFTIVEFFGGILTNSIAIIADSLHDLGDSLSLGFSCILHSYSKKGRTKKFSYGYKRFSLLAALFNSIVLIIGSIIVIYNIIPRLINPEPSNYTGMLLLAVLGIIVNGIAVLRLKKGNSLNEKVVSWHLFEDVFGWLSILVISIVNQFIEIPILDPLLAIFFTLIIIFNVVKSFKQIASVFLQGVPSNIDIDELEKKIQKLNNVESVHDTHIWTMDNENNVLTLHVVVRNKIPYSKMKDIKCKIKELAQKMNIQHVTVEIEKKNETCDYEKC